MLLKAICIVIKHNVTPPMMMELTLSNEKGKL